MFLKRVNLFFVTAAHFCRVYTQLLYGVWKISKLPAPIVTIFGSARVAQTTPYAKQANELARMFTHAKISVLTGGGPGIMEAANCGVIRDDGSKVRSIGVGVRGIDEKQNPCVNEYFELNYFFARKWLLTRFSSAFVVFPGGFGTLDELTEILTLIQTKKAPRAPIVLVGTEYWQPFITWIRNETLAHDLVPSEEFTFFSVTDDLTTAFDLVRNHCDIPQEDEPTKKQPKE